MCSLFTAPRLLSLLKVKKITFWLMDVLKYKMGNKLDFERTINLGDKPLREVYPNLYGLV
jgi:hypothetical protein